MSSKPKAMRDAFLERICEQMANDEKIFFLTADFGSPVLDRIREQFPDRFANVGIAEQNLINVSAGLAIEGFTVFAYAIAPFITMRCFEQIRVNLALLSKVRPMNVNLIGVGAGYSYVVSGPTHQCYEDLSIMRALPNIGIYSPSDYVTAGALFDSCLKNTGPKYLRFDAQVIPAIYESSSPDIQTGFNVLNEGNSVCLLATGYMTHTALKVKEQLAEKGIHAGVIDLFDISNFNNDKLRDVLSAYTGIVTMEEGFSGRGGLDALVFDFITREELNNKILNIGVDPGYRFELGARSDLHEQVGIGADVVTEKVSSFYQLISNDIPDKSISNLK